MSEKENKGSEETSESESENMDEPRRGRERVGLMSWEMFGEYWPSYKLPAEREGSIVDGEYRTDEPDYDGTPRYMISIHGVAVRGLSIFDVYRARHVSRSDEEVRVSDVDGRLYPGGNDGLGAPRAVPRALFQHQSNEIPTLRDPGTDSGTDPYIEGGE